MVETRFIASPTKAGAFLWCFASMAKFLREPPGGPRSGGEAMSEAKPVRWRPCEAGARPN
jgi:hypothetical protein